MLKEGALASTSEAGFTLVELMITVTIVAIIATIATTSYTTQVRESRRTDARSALLDIAGREEKLFSMANAYSAAASDLGYSNAGVTTFPMAVGSGYYSVNVVVPTPTTYTITATAIGTQANDAQCLTLFLDQTGTQNFTGTGTTKICWGN